MNYSSDEFCSRNVFSPKTNGKHYQNYLKFKAAFFSKACASVDTENIANKKLS